MMLTTKVEYEYDSSSLTHFFFSLLSFSSLFFWAVESTLVVVAVHGRLIVADLEALYNRCRGEYNGWSHLSL